MLVQAIYIHPQGKAGRQKVEVKITDQRQCFGFKPRHSTQGPNRIGSPGILVTQASSVGFGAVECREGISLKKFRIGQGQIEISQVPRFGHPAPLAGQLQIC